MDNDKLMEKKQFRDFISQIPTSLPISGLLKQFQLIQKELIPFYSNIEESVFFSKPKQGWSPLENVKHLQSSTFPVALFLRKELRFMLFLFGKGTSQKTTQETIETYRSRLSSGSGAGFFTPFGVLHFPSAGKKQNEISQLESSIESILDSLPTWTEEELDEICMLHPILGIIPMREMLYFTLYHLCHHSSIIQERLMNH
jgi:hypothetical protein